MQVHSPWRPGASPHPLWPVGIHRSGLRKSLFIFLLSPLHCGAHVPCCGTRQWALHVAPRAPTFFPTAYHANTIDHTSVNVSFRCPVRIQEARPGQGNSLFPCPLAFVLIGLLPPLLLSVLCTLASVRLLACAPNRSCMPWHIVTCRDPATPDSLLPHQSRTLTQYLCITIWRIFALCFVHCFPPAPPSFI